MPKLSVWLVRASLVQMGIGFLFGSMLLHHKGVPIYSWTWNLREPHIEIMIFGWTMQFVMGIGFWILPRLPAPNRFGNVRLGWCSFWILNVGIAVTGFGAWFEHGAVSLTGRLLTFVALTMFVIVIRPRVKPLGGDSAIISVSSVSISQNKGELS